MNKTEVYSWRLSRSLKVALEDAAREEGVSVSEVLERAARGWLDRSRSRRRSKEDDEARRVRSAAMKFVGSVAGGDPRRAEHARRAVRARLRRRHADEG